MPAPIDEPTDERDGADDGGAPTAPRKAGEDQTCGEGGGWTANGRPAEGGGSEGEAAIADGTAHGCRGVGREDGDSCRAA